MNLRQFGCLGSVMLLAYCVGCNDTPQKVDAGPHIARGLAVVHRDQTVSVSVLDPNTRQTHTGCIDSGSVSPRLTQALSGDVVLPSQPTGTGELVLIDRGNSAVVWVDAATCTPLRQLSVGAGFAANPRDMVQLSESRAYVTRYNPNNASNATDNNRGSDVLIIDPRVPAIVGRIDLSDYASSAGSAMPTYARPDRMVLRDNNVYVSLGNVTADFKAGGDGRIVVIDATTDTVTQAMDILDIYQCSQLSLNAAGTRLAVACPGIYGDPQQAEHSGMVVFDLAGPAPVQVQTLRGSNFPGAYIAQQPLFAWEDSVFFVTTPLVAANGEDVLWQANVGEAPVPLRRAERAFCYASVAVTPLGELYLVDRGANALLYFKLPLMDTLSTPGETVLGPDRGLPPDALGWF